MKQVNVHEAKTELSRLLELVEAGERVIIARAGRPVAVLSAYQPSVRRRKLGQFRGQGTIPEDFDELPAELARAFVGKLALSLPAEQWLPEVLRKTRFDPLEVDLAAALRVRSLPWHHRDPFDRLLIAQAMETGLTVATRDERFAAYGLSILSA